MGQGESLVSKEDALPDRSAKMQVSQIHAVNKNPTVEPFPDHVKFAMFGMGCFWGAERKFWQTKGVFSTQLTRKYMTKFMQKYRQNYSEVIRHMPWRWVGADRIRHHKTCCMMDMYNPESVMRPGQGHVGFAGGVTENPSYKDACSGKTNHCEVVRLQFDPSIIKYTDLLKVFWENHDPTQGMRQGNDRGTQYRSAIYCYGDEQLATAQASKKAYQEELMKKGYSEITTEILLAPNFYYADDYHQQYLHKNPSGYCGLRGTGVSCPRPDL